MHSKNNNKHKHELCDMLTVFRHHGFFSSVTAC